MEEKMAGNIYDADPVGTSRNTGCKHTYLLSAHDILLFAGLFYHRCVQVQEVPQTVPVSYLDNGFVTADAVDAGSILHQDERCGAGSRHLLS